MQGQNTWYKRSSLLHATVMKRCLTLFYAFDWLYIILSYISSFFIDPYPFLFFLFCFILFQRILTSFFRATSLLTPCFASSADTVFTDFPFNWNWSLLFVTNVFKLSLCWWTWCSLPYQKLRERVFLIGVLLFLPLKFIGGFVLELMCTFFIKFYQSKSHSTHWFSPACVASIGKRKLFCWTRYVHESINLSKDTKICQTFKTDSTTS